MLINYPLGTLPPERIPAAFQMIPGGFRQRDQLLVLDAIGTGFHSQENTLIGGNEKPGEMGPVRMH
jgi:hypothetical protein